MPLFQPIRIERGTFNPVFTSSDNNGVWVYGTQAGRYTVIDNLCFFHCVLSASNRTSTPTGSAIVGGLPYSAINVGEPYIPVTLDTINAVLLLSTTVQLSARVQVNSNRIQFIENPNNGSATFLPATSFNVGCYMRVSGFYEI